MSELVLPSSKQLRDRVRMLECLVAVPAVAVIAAYLAMLLELASGDWLKLGGAVLAFASVVAASAELARRRHLRAVAAYLDARTQEARPGRELCRVAFRSVIALPRGIMQQMMLIWGLAPVVILLLAWALGFGGFRLDQRLLFMLVAGCLGAMISGSFVFFGSKRVLTSVRTALAAEITDPVERAALVTSTPLSRKLQLVVLGVVLGTSMLTISLALSRASRSVDQMAADWQLRMLDALASRLAVAGGDGQAASFEQALAEIAPDPVLLPFSTRFMETRLELAAGPEARFDQRVATRIESALGVGQQSGTIIGSADAGVVSWRAMRDGRLLLATLQESGAGAALGSFYVALALALLLSGSVSLGVSYLMADDFTRATKALCDEAERMAQGDLSRGRVWEAEDEMGGLGRAFERMGSALRATVGRVAEAADRVDGAAGEIASISRSVAVANADQVRRIQQANELMLQIKEQVAGVSNSAQALNVSVEESSSSILELGAAGDELNDTASVLSSKVDEVSGSIEQMVRSVRQVSATTDGLSDAAAETSSSMEEMASAMRAVDTTAALTAKISNEVVVHAESGQQKVAQTMRGMEAIRDATDAAERVIRGLGVRAMEIGGILDVIDDVADETNLLALNAAIIAAQAGEHGRAFSVVADEIKELADRVLASTKEIGSLIRSVQAESENAVGAIEAGSSSVASGVELSAEAGTALEEITRASRESGSRIGEIVGAVREQTKATAHVVTLMEGVRDGVEQISLASGEQDRGNEIVFRSAVTMREVAQQVRRTTEEQSRGFSRIRDSVEGVREAVESINGSLQDQTMACSQVASFLEQVFEGTRSNEEAAQRMGESMQDLLTQAQTLRDDVAKFRI